MNKDEIYALKGNNPVALKDGRMGLLIRFPGDDGLCGVQVPAEENIRWIPSEKLSCYGDGALKE